MKRLLPLFFVVFLATSSFVPERGNPYYSEINAALTFVTPRFTELPLGTVLPAGWLLRQLQIMRDGTTGHLDEVYDKLKNSNGWLGGTGDGWEETPYWLDGAVPLAYLLDDKALKEKVLRYINWTLDHQRPSGYFGPLTGTDRAGTPVSPENCTKGEDWWPKMVMLKVLQQYYSATKDPRVLPFMQKYFDYQLRTLKACPLGQWTEWAASRGSENILMAQWLYTLLQEPSLLELASLIESQSFPWSTWLGNRDWVIEAAAHQNAENWMHRHGVNVSMGLKSPALNYQRTGDENYLRAQKTGYCDLMTLHGLPMGIFSSDEDLHGNDPGQGAELCAIVETMYSLEQSLAITGDVDYMDALERIAYNALPTQTTDDYNAKQYYQIPNQVQVKKGIFNFSLPMDRQMTNVLGMRSGYTCCLANMHQGWTKYATHLWYQTSEKGLAAVEYSPCRVTATVGNTNTGVLINEVTDYPFDENILFEINTSIPVDFPIQLRIPSWCHEAVVLLNGKELRRDHGGQMITINRTWQGGDKLTLQLSMEVRVSQWGSNSRAIERGPLVYALKLEERWEKGHDESEGDYWCVFPVGDWNYGLIQKTVTDPASSVKVTKTNPINRDFTWNLKHAPLELITQGRKIPSWQLVNDVAPVPVTDRNGLFKGPVEGPVETITLVPYGFTKVRIVAFPVVP
jgi:uncharacterized protein